MMVSRLAKFTAVFLRNQIEALPYGTLDDCKFLQSSVILCIPEGVHHTSDKDSFVTKHSSIFMTIIVLLVLSGFISLVKRVDLD